MTDTQSKKPRGLIAEPNTEAVVEEVIEALLHPDRAHHDELGRTREPDDDGEPGPREQPAAPLDVEHVDE
jgi:hypothetical protein